MDITVKITPAQLEALQAGRIEPRMRHALRQLSAKAGARVDGRDMTAEQFIQAIVDVAAQPTPVPTVAQNAVAAEISALEARIASLRSRIPTSPVDTVAEAPEVAVVVAAEAVAADKKAAEAAKP